MFYLLILVLPVTECAFKPHIVDGSKVPLKIFPHSVFMTVSDGNIAYICGGSILNQRIILTAAHCLETVKKDDTITTYAGNAERRKGQMIKGIRFKMHEGYDELALDNDIALVLLEKTLPLGKNMKRIAIYRIPPARKLAHEQTGESSDWLHSTKQKVWTYTECRRILGRIPRGTLCAGDFKNTGFTSVVIKSEMEGHVVGGAYTHIERYPHSILLEVKCEQFYACGGSLITNDIVLTAGHCMYGCKKNHIININYGSENIDKMQQISATKYVLHHNYNRHSLNCDIALLLAMTPLPFGIAVKRVALLRAIRRYNEIEAHKTEATVCECIMFLIICALMILTESKYVPEPFVVNGNKVEYEDEFPHAVFIAVINPNGAFGCGSSMLNQKILLTAAHCIDYYDEIDYINAFAGSLRRYRGIKIRVLAFTIHEKFSSALMGNDIALALLKENLPLGDHVARVSIQRSLPNEHFGYIAGWGLTNWRLRQCSSCERLHSSWNRVLQKRSSVKKFECVYRCIIFLRMDKV
ncbi:unnamed protein product [Leptidea sinapis]|uniref:Peptidase S1 domain-containing protein n=1 Tax=Leptidea sinapis TaxID=189913 RepID=A0A5E4R6U9_9NEOP|nr:unnamed protein product [Leptidea sinapis]